MKKIWQNITSRENRPITVYFVLIFFIAAFLMYNRLGYLSLLWSLLAVVLFAVPIPAPLFAWRYLTSHNLEQHFHILWQSYLLAYVLTSGALWFWFNDEFTALFMGFLYYGYPGTILFALRLWRKKSR